MGLCGDRGRGSKKYGRRYARFHRLIDPFPSANLPSAARSGETQGAWSVRMSDVTPGNRLDRPVDEKFDHILGPADAPITLVEYGSYACPYCRAANERIAEVRDQFGARMRYVFRHRPLVGVELRAARPSRLSAPPIRGVLGRVCQAHDALRDLDRGRPRSGRARPWSVGRLRAAGRSGGHPRQGAGRDGRGQRSRRAV